MNVSLVQLPFPRLNLGRQTGSAPLGAACPAGGLASTSVALPAIAFVDAGYHRRWIALTASDEYFLKAL